MAGLISSIRTLFESAGYGPFSCMLSFLVGVTSAVASACCTLPIIGAIAGYSIVQRQDRSSILQSTLLFMAGSFVTLMAIGISAVFAGQTIRIVSGDYWKIIAGCAALFFGIGALELFPIKLPKRRGVLAQPGGAGLGPGIAGMVFGGTIAACSLPCNPGIFIMFVASVLQKHSLWAIINLVAYAIGFSVPLALLVSGFSLGKSVLALQKLERIIRVVAGIILVLIGIYFFYSLRS